MDRNGRLQTSRRRLTTPGRRRSASPRYRGDGLGHGDEEGYRNDSERDRRTSRSPSRHSRSGQRESRSRRRSEIHQRELSQASACLREREQALKREQERLRLEEDEIQRERSRLRDTRDRSENQTVNRGYSGEENRAVKNLKRSGTPTFSSKEVIELMNTAKTQLWTKGDTHSRSVNHKNILSDFDPSKKGQRIDMWLKKVNECATVYGWDDKTIIHFALQKLQGLAKTWYESLNSILFTWPEWQQKLSIAFPFEQNYGQCLEDMLNRKNKPHEPIEVYFFEKLALLNQCNIVGKRAVECIIHGLTDKTMKTSALSLRCSEPDQLLQFLMSNKDGTDVAERFFARSGPDNEFRLINNDNSKTSNKTNSAFNDSELYCFNCKEKGHLYRKCPKHLIKCSRCNRVGHKEENCFVKLVRSKDDVKM